MNVQMTQHYYFNLCLRRTRTYIPAPIQHMLSMVHMSFGQQATVYDRCTVTNILFNKPAFINSRDTHTLINCPFLISYQIVQTCKSIRLHIDMCLSNWISVMYKSQLFTFIFNDLFLALHQGSNLEHPVFSPGFYQLNYIVTQHCSVVTPAASERSVPSPFCSQTKTPFIIATGQVLWELSESNTPRREPVDLQSTLLPLTE